MLSPTETPGNFEFAFNDVDLSDRVFHIEITEDSLNHGGHDRVPNRKRMREDLEKENVIQKWHERITQREVTLRVNTSEEAALVDLLKFMYSNTLGATGIPDLVDVLVAADKFQVISCMKHCIMLLQKAPMSLESALVYLELPSSVVDNEILQPLIHAAKRYLSARYRDFRKSREEMMSLPLSAIEVVFGTDGLHVVSEDYVYDFILKWARKYYPDMEERRDVLTKRLSRLLCFRRMSSMKLNQVLDCPDFEHEVCKLERFHG